MAAFVQVLGSYCGENTPTTSDETNAESLPEDAEEATIIPNIHVLINVSCQMQRNFRNRIILF